MPEYRAPGLYVEEANPRRSPIAGVPTSVTGFVGVAASGPVGVVSAPLQSLADFERIYGAPDPASAPDDVVNHLWHAARGFFASGGGRLHIVRVPLSRKRALPGPILYSKALDALARQEDVALVAAPGASRARQSHAILSALIEHAETCPGRFALIDSVPGSDLGAAIAWRNRFESSRAAFYYPWLRVVDPFGRDSLQPPSGFVAGIVARVDAERGIWKAPANETIDVAGLEKNLTDAQQDILGVQSRHLMDWV